MLIKIQALRYGESGSGKTEMLRTWPLDVKAGEWMYIFDFDGGLNTIRNPLTGLLPPGIYGATFRDTKQRIGPDKRKLQRQGDAFPRALDTLNSLIMGEGGELFSDAETELQEKPTVVAIDTLSGLHDAAMNLSLTLDPKTGLGGAPAMHHWGAQMRYVEEFVRMCEAEDWHLDVTAHVKAWQDELLGTSRGSVMATGKASPGLIPTWFDEVYYHSTRQTADGVSYILRVQNDGFFTAKSRLKLQEDINVTLPSAVLRGKESSEGHGWSHIFKLLSDMYNA